MGGFHRRRVLSVTGMAMASIVTGCINLGSNPELPSDIPLYGRNNRSESATVQYWTTTTATASRDDLDGVEHLEPGEYTHFTDVPVEASPETAEAPTEPADVNDQTDDPRDDSDGATEEVFPTPVKSSSGSFLSVTANLVGFDDQRNVHLSVRPGSESFSDTGYVITVLEDPVRDVGTPDEPVSAGVDEADATVTGDYLRIEPRSGEQ